MKRNLRPSTQFRRSKFLQVVLLACSFPLLITSFVNCSGSAFDGTVATGTTAAPTPNPTSNPLTVSAGQANVLPMVVSAACGSVQSNMPCVTITVCVPGTTTCQTIPNVLLDTGSFGLRIYNKVAATGDFNTLRALTVTLPMEADPSNAANVITQCETFGGFSTWGPMVKADVVMAGETAPSVPIQLVNSTFATIPASAGCHGPSAPASTTPADLGVNGILGVGPLPNDCGAYCVPGARNASSNGIYFSCPSSGSGSCTGIAVAIAQQVTNPVGLLPVDNNGVIVQMPNVADVGAPEADGYVIFGIGTQSNNTPPKPSAVVVMPATNDGGKDYQRDFTTSYNGVSLPTSIIDSGSPYFFFNGPSSLSVCTQSDLAASGFYCPTTETTYTATLQGGSSSALTVSFQITTAVNLESSTNFAFQNIGAQGDSTSFDWGLPFFYGRTIYFGLSGQTSSLGAGPFYAY